MKKSVILFCFVSACFFLLTGCDNKTILKCTMNSNGVDTNFNIGFNGNKIEKMDLQYLMDLTNYSDSQIDVLKDQDFCIGLKSDMEEFKEAFANCNQKLEDKKLNIVADFDVNKISSSQLSKMQTPENAKKDLENSGYKCTIEK